jgi:hypothetical protein
MVSQITYTDVVNQVRDHGWTIVSQTPDSTQIEKQVGAPRIPAIVLALIPIVGMIIAVAWIYFRGQSKVTIERKLTTAHIITGSNSYDVSGREQLEMFFTTHNYSGNIGYYPVVIIGVVIIFIGALLVQFAA